MLTSPKLFADEVVRLEEALEASHMVSAVLVFTHTVTHIILGMLIITLTVPLTSIRALWGPEMRLTIATLAWS